MPLPLLSQRDKHAPRGVAHVPLYLLYAILSSGNTLKRSQGAVHQKCVWGVGGVSIFCRDQTLQYKGGSASKDAGGIQWRPILVGSFLQSRT